MGVTKATFQELGQLMRAKSPSLGELATAIEESGIYGWDIYGRFKHFAPDSEQGKQVLETIAEEFAWRTGQRSSEKLSPLDWEEGFCVFTKYGWPSDKLPDFKRHESTELEAPEPPMRESSIKKTENASAAIIGALLAYIKGEVNNHRHPMYRGKDEPLIDELLAAYNDFDGISRSNLINKFALGKAILSSTGVRKHSRTRSQKSSKQ